MDHAAEGLFIGVSLVSEAYNKTSTSGRDTCLGLVTAERDNATLSDFRQSLCLQLPAIPTSFIFLTKEGAGRQSNINIDKNNYSVLTGHIYEPMLPYLSISISQLLRSKSKNISKSRKLLRGRWPISKSQESHVTLHQVIDGNIVRVQRCYSKPRVGLEWGDGRALGFVFAEHTCSVRSLRDAVMKQLQYIPEVRRTNFLFRDRNGWPIGHSQENSLTVMDIVQNSTVQIIPERVMVQTVHTNLDLLDGAQEAYTALKQRHSRALTFTSNKDLQRQAGVIEIEDESQKKEILISYVRAEAAQHAVDLKESLENLGLSVFLDVHEIKSGVDWQDALNFAVSNCESFVPIVTPAYGETQWTNREVKLADVLNKVIIPVSFLPYWPPKSLAIQFATTQYIPFKPEDLAQENHIEEKLSLNESAAPWQPWDVRLVAEQIVDRLKELTLSSPDVSLLTKPSVLKSCPAMLPVEFAELSQDRIGKPLIVISVHPEQKAIGEELKALFEPEGYEVWCSSEVMDGTQTSTTLDLSTESTSTDELPGSQGTLFSQESPKKLSPSAATASTQPAEHFFPDMSPRAAESEEGSSSLISLTKTERGLRFQEKADAAGVVIFVLSKSFSESKFSRQQVFYCEHRKRVVSMRAEDFLVPWWMSMLIGTAVFEVLDQRAQGFKASLLRRVKRAMDPVARDCCLLEGNEAKILYAINSVKRIMPKAVTVYIAGGTNFYHHMSDDICKAIGKHLAGLDIHVVTGGFLGVGDTVASSYNEERGKQNKPRNIWHILPERDIQDRSKHARQNKDKTFQIVPYGKTLFCGDSVRERETIVSRMFDICILIEGGPGAAHEAEQFCWNDHVVIPIQSTGGAAGGKFNVPSQIFKVPVGVDLVDWAVLKSQASSPDDIGEAVARIITSVVTRLRVDSPTRLAGKLNFPRTQSSPRKLRQIAKRKTLLPTKRSNSFTSGKTVVFKKQK